MPIQAHEVESVELNNLTLKKALPVQQNLPSLERNGTYKRAEDFSSNLIQIPNANYVAECMVDFTDEVALLISTSTLWFDRIYSPWYQTCQGMATIYIKPLVNDHVHLGFEDPDVMPCPTNAQAYPSHSVDQYSCDFVNIPDEPRTHITTHTNSEVIDIRVYNNDGAYIPFGLKQISVTSQMPVKLCFRKKTNYTGGYKAVTNNELEISEMAQDTLVNVQPVSEGVFSPSDWSCWNELGFGTWDVSNTLIDAVEVKVSAAMEGGSFSIDNILIGLK